MIPQYTINAIRSYVENGIIPGGFLKAVLTNDLFGAFAHADSSNKEALSEICQYIYNEIPANCWGSKEILLKYSKSKLVDNVS